MRVDLPLKRKSDKRDIGQLTLIRTLHWQFTDEAGRRLSMPAKEDLLIISLRNAAGEEIYTHELPMKQLQLDHDANSL